mmetsp:Transcript_76546/g.192629  ORF Transcript_76546/g.192629 Transcript_76546/m.192629 type:complete len:99 (-) Transcript_76546:55-351(-)
MMRSLMPAHLLMPVSRCLRRLQAVSSAASVRTGFQTSLHDTGTCHSRYTHRALSIHVSRDGTSVEPMLASGRPREQLLPELGEQSVVQSHCRLLPELA